MGGGTENILGETLVDVPTFILAIFRWGKSHLPEITPRAPGKEGIWTQTLLASKHVHFSLYSRYCLSVPVSKTLVPYCPKCHFICFFKVISLKIKLRFILKEKVFISINRKPMSFSTCYKWEFTIKVTDPGPTPERQELCPSWKQPG